MTNVSKRGAWLEYLATSIGKSPKAKQHLPSVIAARRGILGRRDDAINTSSSARDDENANASYSAAAAAAAALANNAGVNLPVTQRESLLQQH